MANNTQFDPQNPDALFSPDQWLNQFSRFNNAALPWPSSYVGTPTDAMGRPIQPPPGMTLNSAPAPAAPASPVAPAAAQQAIMPPGGWGLGMNGANPAIANTPSFGGSQYAGSQYMPQAMPYMPAPQQQQAAPPQAAPQAAAPNNWQNTIAMLANPGKVTTPGATVPASAASAQPGPGGLQAFLQNWRPASSGPGSGFQQGFANALKGMGY